MRRSALTKWYRCKTANEIYLHFLFVFLFLHEILDALDSSFYRESNPIKSVSFGLKKIE